MEPGSGGLVLWDTIEAVNSRRRAVPKPPKKGKPAGRRARAGASAKRPVGLGVRAKIWLTLGPRTLFGEGKAELLEHVDRLGSLRRAAQRMEMSYRYAWGLLQELERSAGFAFLEHSGAGRRSRLRMTDEGRRFVRAYRSFRGPIDAYIRSRFARTFGRRSSSC
jgi:molybdate transport system regulatory protein